MSWLQDCWVVLECANCSMHGTVKGALSETVATVSLSTVPRLSLLSRHLRVGKRTCGGGQAVLPDLPCVYIDAGIK